MIYLTNFDIQPSVPFQPDWKERVSQVCLGLWRVALGKTVQISYCQNKAVYEGTSTHLLHRISALAVSILLFKVTFPLAVLGFVAARYSFSYNQHLSSYQTQLAFKRTHSRLLWKTLTAKDVDRALKTYGGVKEGCLRKMIEMWRQHRSFTNKECQENDLEELCQALNNGTCRGQAVNILEFLLKTKEAEVNEESLHSYLEADKSVFYQILHYLDVFLSNLEAAYVYGINRLESIKLLQSLLPPSKITKSSERIQLNLDKAALQGRIADYLTLDILDRSGSAAAASWAIEVSLRTKSSGGHATIMYYNNTQKRYYWYDCYDNQAGLFSTDNYKTFLKGIVSKIKAYESKNYINFRLTAYQL